MTTDPTGIEPVSTVLETAIIPIYEESILKRRIPA
jgi:hypothetical protein